MTYDFTIKNAPAGTDDWFGFNNFTMSRVIDAMDELGMIQMADSPTWPKPEDHGLTHRDVWQWEDEDARPNAPEPVRAFLDAHDRARDGAPENTTGIAIYKLGSNDGWLVTEVELRAALKSWDAAAPEQQAAAAVRAQLRDAERWPAWIAYMRTAAACGGFRVY